MNTYQKTSMLRLEIALITFYGLLLLSLLIIFVVEPSIYTTTLVPGSAATERYPLPAILFLVALVAFLSVLMYGVIHHWRWLFWLILVAFSGSLIQIPVELLQLMGVLPNPYPIWYGLFRAGAGVVEMGFAIWMIQTYRHAGVWAMGKKKKAMELLLECEDSGVDHSKQI